jgi:hypothetical protein
MDTNRRRESQRVDTNRRRESQHVDTNGRRESQHVDIKGGNNNFYNKLRKPGLKLETLGSNTMCYSLMAPENMLWRVVVVGADVLVRGE